MGEFGSTTRLGSETKDNIGGYLTRQVVFHYDKRFPVEGSDRSVDFNEIHGFNLNLHI